METVKFKKTHPDAKTPTKHLEAACWDLYSVVETEVSSGQTKIIDVGISIELPKGWLARIHTRSGYALKGIRNHLGIVDQDFRGDVGPIMHNCSDTIKNIKKGDKVAQIFFEKIDEVDLVEVTELKESERGEKGFGSSGR